MDNIAQSKGFITQRNNNENMHKSGLLIAYHSARSGNCFTFLILALGDWEKPAQIALRHQHKQS